MICANTFLVHKSFASSLRKSIGIYMYATASMLEVSRCSTLMLLSVVLCLVQSSEHHIRAGNGSDSLANYLHNAGMEIPSFTTLVFSSGVHHMCEDRAVVIRDVTDIALIGSDITHTTHVQVGGGETVNVIEPSTVIDCKGCPTGFAFINVSQLTLKKILICNCGAYFDTLLYQVQFVSSLTLASVYKFTLDTITFHGTGLSFNLVSINALGPSDIRNLSVLQEVNGLTNSPWTLPLSYIEGGILISYTDGAGYFVELESSRSLSIDSLVFYYRIEFELGPKPMLMLNISSCTLDSVSITLQNVALHIWLHDTNKIVHNEDVVSIEIGKCVKNYQLYMQNVSLSANASHLLYKPVYLMYVFSVIFSSDSQPLQHYAAGVSVKRMTFLELQLSDDYKFRIFSSAGNTDTINRNSSCHHHLLFDQCKMSHFLITTDSSSCVGNDAAGTLHVTISNTSFEYRAIDRFFESGLLEAKGTRNIVIKNCTFAHNLGPGIHLIQSQVTFFGNCVVYNNTAEYGGGILLQGSESLLYLSPHTILNFTRNTALVTGGAMNIDTFVSSERYSNLCVFQMDIRFSSLFHDIRLIAEDQDIQIVFDSNTASIAGTTIWGGSLDMEIGCFMFVDNNRNYTNIVPLLGLENNASNPSVIASAPLHMCYCYSNKTMTCTPIESWEDIHIPSFSVYPGQSLELDIAMAGQLNGLVPGLVEASIDLLGDKYNDIDVHIEDIQRTQRISKAECTKLVYTFYSSSVEEIKTGLCLDIAEDITVPLDYDDSQEKYITYSLSFRNSLSIDITLKRCPLGFRHNSAKLSCTCQKAILKYLNSSCDINTQTVERTATLWMNASYTGSNTQILAVHQHCPFDYCDHNKLRVDLSSPDQQCTHNRAGVLCGGCKIGLSLTLGSSKCRHCSNNFLSLLLAFTAAGLALVAMLTCLNLTVSVGTINALILYANIVRALNPVFFPSTTFLSVFVAWLNLDFGLDSCFYDGLDFYSLTWLQFVFPVYIWLLVSVMILTSHYSTTAAKLVSRDAVKVLATLFLLSYAKLLRTILTVLSFTYISYEDTSGATHRTAVWLYDGNVEFTKGKHMPLILAAVSFGVLYIVPFTALLLFAPILQTKSHRYTVLKWVNKLMPFLDAYQGPYGRRYRFWPGLTLLLRVILFVSFAMNSLGDPDINLMLTISLVIGLLSFELLLGMTFKSEILHKSIYLNYLEIFYLLDLGLLCTWSVLQTDGTSLRTRQRSVISGVLVGVAFLVFMGILNYHVYLRIKSSSVLLKLYKRIRKQGDEHGFSTTATEQEDRDQTTSGVAAQVPITYVQLRESLLTSN